MINELVIESRGGGLFTTAKSDKADRPKHCKKTGQSVNPSVCVAGLVGGGQKTSGE